MNYKQVLISAALCFLTIGCEGSIPYLIFDDVIVNERTYCNDSSAMNYSQDQIDEINNDEYDIPVESNESCYYCGDYAETILEKKYSCCRDTEALNLYGTGTGTWSDTFNSYPFNPNTDDRQYCIYDELEFEYFLTQLDSAGWDNIWD